MKMKAVQRYVALISCTPAHVRAARQGAGTPDTCAAADHIADGGKHSMALSDKQANAFYWSKKWKRKRDEILRRDHYECQMCRARIKEAARNGEQLHGYDSRIHRAVCVHHIKELKDYPELALDDDNLISLCHVCHDRIHGRDSDHLSAFRYTQKFPEKEELKEKW